MLITLTYIPQYTLTYIYIRCICISVFISRIDTGRQKDSINLYAEKKQNDRTSVQSNINTRIYT